MLLAAHVDSVAVDLNLASGKWPCHNPPACHYADAFRSLGLHARHVPMKKLIFSAAALTPLVAIVAGTFYLLLLTNLPQVLYEGSIRNIYFNCFDFVSAPYVYKMKPGPCPLKNIEFDVSFSHDADGFRNPLATASDIVAIGNSQIMDSESGTIRLSRPCSVLVTVIQREIWGLPPTLPCASLKSCESSAQTRNT